MKKYLILAAAMLAIVGCKSKQPNNQYTISGNVAELTAGDTLKIEIYNDKTNNAVNTAVVDNDGNFKFEGTVNEAVMAQILTQSRDIVGMVYLEPGDIKSETLKEETLFKGTPLNDANSEITEKLTSVMEQYQALPEEGTDSEERGQQLYEEYQAIIRSAVEENRDNVLGVDMLVYQLTNTLDSGDELLSIIDSFSEEMQQKEIMISTREHAEQMLKSSVGQKYIDIILNDTNDESVALSSLIAPGKYVLLDFWATWCGPCMGEMPHLKEAYAEYHAKGFEIYGVSLDSNRDSWLKFATTLPWVNVLHLSDSQAGHDYSVSAIPSNFLIAPDGTIVAKNLRGSALMEKLSEIIK